MVSLGRSINVNGVEQKYLNMKTIPEYQPVECIAYVHDVKLSTTRYDVGFATFILKDVNSNLVSARLFDLENYMLSGYKASEFKHKPVVFTCTAQEFNGQISLVIDQAKGISVWDGEFDAQRFVGIMDSSFYTITEKHWDSSVVAMIEETPFRKWQSSILEQLCSGKIGGFAKYAEVVFSAIEPYLTKDYKDDLMKCYLVTMDYYFQFLRDREKSEVVGDISAYKYLNAITTKYDGSDMKNLYLDCFGALVGINKPMHLFSHVISNASQYAKNTLRLFVKFDSIPFGSKVQVGTGGVELSNY
jgi:hypothetical protein